MTGVARCDHHTARTIRHVLCVRDPTAVRRLNGNGFLAKARCKLELFCIRFQVRHYLVTRGVTRKILGHRPIRQPGKPPIGMQVQAIVLLTPPSRHLRALLEQDVVHSGPLQAGSRRQAGCAGTDDHRACLNHRTLTHGCTCSTGSMCIDRTCLPCSVSRWIVPGAEPGRAACTREAAPPGRHVGHDLRREAVRVTRLRHGGGVSGTRSRRGVLLAAAPARSPSAGAGRGCRAGRRRPGAG